MKFDLASPAHLKPHRVKTFKLSRDSQSPRTRSVPSLFRFLIPPLIQAFLPLLPRAAFVLRAARGLVPVIPFPSYQ